jgi:hypothetical protein
MKPEVGQIWLVKPGGCPMKDGHYLYHFDWKRYVRIEETDASKDRCTIRTVEKRNGNWFPRPGTRSVRAKLSRFDGTYHNYGFVERQTS